MKIRCSKYIRNIKKFKKVTENTPKVRGDMLTSSKNVNIYINWEKECFKALKKWLR